MCVFQGFFNTKFEALVCELNIALTLLFAFQEQVLILGSRCGLQFLTYDRGFDKMYQKLNCLDGKYICVSTTDVYKTSLEKGGWWNYVCEYLYAFVAHGELDMCCILSQVLQLFPFIS